MTDQTNGSKRKSTERIYLAEEEIKVLAESLEEWNDKPDKKTRDGFVAAEILPKIQQLNLEKFGPDMLSKDKAAKILWERRIKVEGGLELIRSMKTEFNYRQSILGTKTTNPSRIGRSSVWKGRFPSEEL